MKLTIGKVYKWAELEDLVQVKDVENDIAYVEIKRCKDGHYVVGQRMWVFIKDLKEEK